VRRLLLVLLLLVAGCSDHPKQGPTSTRLTYDVVDPQGEHTRQVIDMQPPYRARTLTYRGEESLGGFLWDETGTYTVAPDGSIAQSAAIGPGFPGPASHLDVSLPVALRQRLVVRLGPGTSRGKPCTRWRSDGPLDSGARFSPPKLDPTVSCVDANGVVLDEQWSSDTGFVQARTLVSRTKGPSSLYAGKTPQPLPTASSATIVKASTVAELATLMKIPAPAGPRGLTADLATGVLDLDPRRQGFFREAGVMTWVGDGHLAVLRIERDLQAGGGRTVRGEPVQLGGLGQGRLEPVLAGLKVVVEGPRGLRVIATSDLPEDQLLSWLRSLRL
jgi:hypothetical protein